MSDPIQKPEAPSPSSWVLLRRLVVEHVRDYAGKLGLAALATLAAAAATGANAWLLQPAIDEIFIARSERMLLLVPLAVVLVALIKGGAGYFQQILMAAVGQGIIADTQLRMYRHLIRADLAYLHQVHTGKLISSFLYDVGLLRDAVARAATGILKDGFTVVALVVVMFVQDWRLALASLVILPVAGIAMRKLGRRMRLAASRSQTATGVLAQHLSETFEGARLVKAYGMEAHETARAEVAIRRRLKELMRALRTRAMASPIMEALSGIAVAMAILYGGWQAQAGEITLGAFTSFLGALLMAYQPIKGLANLHNSLQEGLAAAERIFAMLDVEPEIDEAAGAEPLDIAGGEIGFEKVSFSYGDALPALEGVSLTVPAGATVALVGPSGAGKSTLLNLIPRFYDAGQGRVLIDGQDVRSLTLASLRGAIALVSQEATLFDDSVRANIAYGRPGASDEEIAAAARAADADGFIQALAQGYDTVLGEGGFKLSGGQRQRIAIARAMLRDAPILLLDEATSALDSRSDAEVQAALVRLMRNRTTVVIAHRLSTVMAADAIHVMDKGRIVETGSHAELLAAGGLYAKLHALQLADQPADRRLHGVGD